MVNGRIEVEYVPLSSGGEIDIVYFCTTKVELEREGFTPDDYIDYIFNQSYNTVVAHDYENNKDIVAYNFKRRDGYNYCLKVDNRKYDFL